MAKPKRAAIYLQVSTDEQITQTQQRELEAVADHHGWQVVAVYEDAGLSGAKGRDKRPGLDAMLKDVTRRRFDVVMAWNVGQRGTLPD
jgi:DNA invertase Pin-like site-specific DNA recombinase